MLYRLLRDSDASVIQTWMYHADLLGGVMSRLARKRVVTWGIRNAYLDASTVSTSARLSAMACARLSSVVPARIVSCSQCATETHARIGYRRDRMQVIPNGYDVTRLAPDADSRAALRTEWSIPDNRVLLGMVARWDAQKDHANLLHALSLIGLDDTQWTVVLIGTDMTPGNAALVALVNRYGLAEKVRLLGPRDDVPRVMNALDVHVLSSVGEAFPNVVAEAMACGTPCVVTDVGDAALIVGETGWVVPARDSQALAGALRDAITEQRDPLVVARRSAAARSRIIAEFSLARMVDSYSRLWTDLSIGAA